MAGIAAQVEPVRFDARDLDASVDPRDDLDAYVNARWRQANPVPGDRSCWDCFSILEEISLQRQAQIADAVRHSQYGGGDEERIVGDFRATAASDIDAQAPTILREELACIDRLDDAASIAAYLRDCHRRGDDRLFRLEIRPDFDDGARAIGYVLPSGLALPDRQCYLDTEGEALRGAYMKHAAAMLALSGVPADGSASAAAQILAFERRLAEVSPSRREIARDIALIYDPTTTANADKLAPVFGWSKFFASAPGKTFSLPFREYQAEIERLLTTLAPATWRAFLRLRAADDAAPYLDAAWRNQHAAFHDATLRGRHAHPPAWKRGLRELNAGAGWAMGRLYARRHANALAPVQRLVDDLRVTLRARIENLDWMSLPTRQAALKKLATLRAKIGAPTRWRDLSGLVTQRASLYANVRAARAFNRRFDLGRCGSPIDADEWSLTPQTANAHYDPQRNEIVIPAALLEAPLYSGDADAALNYGGIGAVVAHELTHAFDDQGSRFDHNGRLRNWWQASDRAQFEARAMQLADQIEGCRGLDGTPIDGRLTLGENIADFGGLAIAHAALESRLAENGAEVLIDGFTQRQRFFLNWAALWRQNLTPEERRMRRRADVHAPSNVRANAAAVNLESYSIAFACRPGDAMRCDDEARVHIW